MANVNVNALSAKRGTGQTITYTTTNTSDVYFCEVSSGTELLKFSNTAGTPVTVTIVPQGNVDGVSFANVTVTVPATSDVVWGTVPSSGIYTANGRLQLTTSAACKLAVLRV